MADSQLLIVLTIFVALCALSQLGQFLAILGLYKKVKEMQMQASPFIRKAEAVMEKTESTLESAKLTLEEGRRHLGEITTKTNLILDSTKDQLHRIDQAVTATGERAKVQLEKVEMLVGDTVDRVQSVVTATHEGVLKPVREINALAAGVRGSLGFLFKRRHPSSLPATQDEEMFI
ncbi:hypothetical protein [Bryobacter aggregatus]|uniref:hypothetical protein n=1 Tax=Bryobacter aggregatus TaxID=360054 RepID=UPI0004E1F332|nr:hypothetical protein [Bryobacter aggregatus]